MTRRPRGADKKMSRRMFLAASAAAGMGAWAASLFGRPGPARVAEAAEGLKKLGAAGRRVVKTNEEWKRILTPEQFYVMRLKGTERPYSGEYVDNKEKGVYRCAGCENDLFSSEAKYDSGTGWPSFWAPIAAENIKTQDDYSYLFLRRTEVLCSVCDAHLGHVFDDGPPPTHLRYCMNSVAFKFVKKTD